MSDIKIIKKHANRRLYDTEARRNVTLSDIRNMIVSGVAIQVIDGSNSEDITRSVLLQIIIERESTGLPILSEDVLVQLIQFYDNPLQGMMKDYLQKSVNTFITQQQHYHAQLQQLLSNSPVEVMHEMMVQNLKSWEAASESFSQSPDESSAKNPDSNPDNNDA